MKKPSNNIGLKDLRENMEVYIDRVNMGESLTIFRRSTPLFKIIPIETPLLYFNISFHRSM